METKQMIYTITIDLNEIKHLVLERVDDAQDVRNKYCLSSCKTYEIWHGPLIDYYKKNKNKAPLMADKLAFVVLLSYPKEYIETLNKISDIKLFNENIDSDFIHIDILESNCSMYDCICSKHKLSIVHIVENIRSGIRLQVGSDCIQRTKLLTNKFKDLQEVLNNFEIEASDSINSTANLIAESFRNGNKILTCGNGGSASDSQHFAAEFVNSFSKTINRVALPAISLTSDSSVLT
jgi:hypothetical protein